jgi:DNA-binding MarR family transcriptional regulator
LRGGNALVASIGYIQRVAEPLENLRHFVGTPFLCFQRRALNLTLQGVTLREAQTAGVRTRGVRVGAQRETFRSHPARTLAKPRKARSWSTVEIWDSCTSCIFISSYDIVVSMRRRHGSRGIDYSALADFRYELRRFLNFSERAAHAAGIEPQQHQALLAIKGQPAGIDTTVGVLAARMQIRHHSAVELSGRLEARGLIRRSRNKRDRRQVQLRLTARAERLLAKLSRAHRRELRAAAPRLARTLSRAVRHRGRARARR